MSDEEPVGEYQQKLARRSELVIEAAAITVCLREVNSELAATWTPERERRRRELLSELQAKEEELRSIKAWLRMNSPSESEWVLLGRLYRFLTRLEEHVRTALPEETEGEVDLLLDSIERVVPGKYLSEEKVAK